MELFLFSLCSVLLLPRRLCELVLVFRHQCGMRLRAPLLVSARLRSPSFRSSPLKQLHPPQSGSNHRRLYQCSTRILLSSSTSALPAELNEEEEEEEAQEEQHEEAYDPWANAERAHFDATFDYGDDDEMEEGGAAKWRKRPRHYHEGRWPEEWKALSAEELLNAAKSQLTKERSLHGSSGIISMKQLLSFLGHRSRLSLLNYLMYNREGKKGGGDGEDVEKERIHEQQVLLVEEAVAALAVAGSESIKDYNKLLQHLRRFAPHSRKSLNLVLYKLNCSGHAKDSITYTTLAQLFHKRIQQQQKLHEASPSLSPVLGLLQSLFRELQEKGTGDPQAYAAFLRIFCLVNDVKSAIAAYDSLQRDGRERHNWLGVSAFPLAQLFMRHRLWDRAVILLEQLKEERSFLEKHVSSRQQQNNLEEKDEQEEKKDWLDRAVFVNLAIAYSHLNEETKLKNLVTEVYQLHCRSLRSGDEGRGSYAHEFQRVCAALVRLYLRRGEEDAANALLRELQKDDRDGCLFRSQIPPLHIYSAFLEHYTKERDLERVMGLVQEIASSYGTNALDEHSYSLMLPLLLSSSSSSPTKADNGLSTIENVVDKLTPMIVMMKENGVKPTGKFFHYLFRFLANSKQEGKILLPPAQLAALLRVMAEEQATLALTISSSFLQSFDSCEILLQTFHELFSGDENKEFYSATAVAMLHALIRDESKSSWIPPFFQLLQRTSSVKLGVTEYTLLLQSLTSQDYNVHDDRSWCDPFQVLETMKRAGLQPDQATFSACLRLLIEQICHTSFKRHDNNNSNSLPPPQTKQLRPTIFRMLDFFRDENVKPNANILATLLSFYARAGDASAAIATVRRFEEKHNILPNTTCYNWLFKLFIQTKSVKYGHQLWTKLKREEEFNLEGQPDRTTYRGVIMLLCRAMPDVAWDVFQEMSSKWPLNPNDIVFAHALTAAPTKAAFMSLLEQIKQQRAKAEEEEDEDEEEEEEEDDDDEAEKEKEEYDESFHPARNPEIFRTACLFQYAKYGMVEEAERALGEMVKEGKRPTTPQLRALMLARRAKGDAAGVERDFAKFNIPPDTAVYNIALQASVQDEKRFQRVRERMEKERVPKDAVTLGLLQRKKSIK
ncbi:Tau tubulin kinase 1 [Balamuthia mandrillaris]